MLAALNLPAQDKYVCDLEHIPHELQTSTILSGHVGINGMIKYHHLDMYRNLEQSSEASKYILPFGKCCLSHPYYVFLTPVPFVFGLHQPKQLVDKNDQQRAQLYLNILEALKFVNHLGIITNYVDAYNIVFREDDASFSKPLIRSLAGAFYKYSSPEHVRNLYREGKIDAIHITHKGPPYYSEIHRIVKFLFALEFCATDKNIRPGSLQHNTNTIMDDGNFGKRDYQKLKKEGSLYNFLFDAARTQNWKDFDDAEFEKALTRFAPSPERLRTLTFQAVNSALKEGKVTFDRARNMVPFNNK